MRKFIQYMVLTAVVSVVGLCGFSMKSKAADFKPEIGYIQAAKDTYVYSKADDKAATVGTLFAGQPAITSGRSADGWLQIYYIGTIGYVKTAETAPYAPPAAQPQGPIAINPPGGLKVNFLGDSITYGYNLRDRNLGYAPQLAIKAKVAKYNNYGWNGSAVGGGNHIDRFVDRYVTMDRDANLVVVLGGTNDYDSPSKHGTPIGTMGDVSPNTFYGALNLMMCGLKQMYPSGEIVFLTPLRRAQHSRRNLDGSYLADYVMAIHRMAAVYGIRVIDLYWEPELDFGAKAGMYLSDGLHPNVMGHAMVSSYLYRKMFVS